MIKYPSNGVLYMVRMRGVEPPRREALDPKSSVYTNFTTSAQNIEK